MRFPIIGLFWGITVGLLGPEFGLSLWVVLLLAVVFTMASLAVRDWYERLNGVDRYHA